MKKSLAAVLCLSLALFLAPSLRSGQAAAQSLRGSQASVRKMYTRAVLTDLNFYRTSKGVYESVRDGELVLISITMDLTLEDVSYPFVLPRTRDVLNVFARRYRETCGQRLVVTSAARPRTEQPRNASPQSVHPTGMAIDFRRPAEPCLSYMRKELLVLERQGILEATEERRPVHFHVAVLQRGKFAPSAPAIATATTPSPTPAPAQAIVAPTPAPSTSTDSAAGSVDVPDKPAAAQAPAKPKTYTVRKGDNLSVIAKRFGLTVTKLKSLNGLKGSSIRPGQRLRIS